MSNLTRREIVPVVEVAIENEPAAHARADPDTQNELGTFARAEFILAIDRDVHVVVEVRRHLCFLGQQVCDRLVLPAQVHRLKHDALLRIDRARRTDADAAELREFDLRRNARLIHGVHDAVEHRIQPLVGLGLLLRLAQQLEVGRDHAHLHVGATEVDPDEWFFRGHGEFQRARKWEDGS